MSATEMDYHLPERQFVKDKENRSFLHLDSAHKYYSEVNLSTAPST